MMENSKHLHTVEETSAKQDSINRMDALVGYILLIAWSAFEGAYRMTTQSLSGRTGSVNLKYVDFCPLWWTNNHQSSFFNQSS